MMPKFLRPEVVPYASVEIVRAPCSHRWIDPTDAPIARAPYSPWLGPRRRELKSGRLYRCANGCGGTLMIQQAEGQ